MFNHLNDIMFHKRGDQLNNVDHESDYNMFMINRWVSMYSPDTCHVINSTANWLHPVFETKQQHYNFLCKVLPTYRKKYINYIKKHKVDDKEKQEHEDLELMSRAVELSQKEVKYLLQQRHERQHRSNNTN